MRLKVSDTSRGCAEHAPLLVRLWGRRGEFEGSAVPQYEPSHVAKLAKRELHGSFSSRPDAMDRSAPSHRATASAASSAVIAGAISPRITAAKCRHCARSS